MTAARPARRPGPAAAIVKRARQMTGLSQASLAARAGVPQTLVSAYERGARDPSVTNLGRLIDAAGLRLTWTLTHGGSGGGPLRTLTGPVGRQLVEHRESVIALLTEAGLHRVRVIGDVAEGCEFTGSRAYLVVASRDGAAVTDSTRLTVAGRLALSTGLTVTLWTDELAAAHGFGPEELNRSVTLDPP